LKKYTIQIIPEGSSQKPRILRMHSWLLKSLVALFCAVIAFAVAVLIHFKQLSSELQELAQFKSENQKLIQQHKEYEIAFMELDSIYIMESKIQNILETFLENDSGKTASILDRNRFKFTPSEKNRVHYDFLYHPKSKDSLKQMNAPRILPVIGKISKPFDIKNHSGIDFAAPLNESVFSTESGMVIETGRSKDLGLFITVKHNEKFITRYAHLARISVEKGQRVSMGQVIGFVGNTGNTNGPHLHYEIIKNGKHVNPENYFNHY
jgi:murein DD-endopeptidase MepM/ murein hydrolase activator NlpD